MFEKLEEARKEVGHGPTEAAAEVGCSIGSYYNWKRGVEPLPAHRRAIEKYIRKHKPGLLEETEAKAK